jgi:hypothetical protein
MGARRQPLLISPLGEFSPGSENAHDSKGAEQEGEEYGNQGVGCTAQSMTTELNDYIVRATVDANREQRGGERDP